MRGSRIVIIESVSIIDALDGRSEASALSNMLKILGHDVCVLPTKSRFDLRKNCEYIASMTEYHEELVRRKQKSLVIHFSGHGNTGCLGFGKDDVEWDELGDLLLPIFNSQYKGDISLCLSACEASHNTLSNYFEEAVHQEKTSAPPSYIISTENELEWDDAAVAWTIFYHRLNQMEWSDVWNKLEDIYNMDIASLHYKRWIKDKKCYRKNSTRS